MFPAERLNFLDHGTGPVRVLSGRRLHLYGECNAVPNGTVESGPVQSLTLGPMRRRTAARLNHLRPGGRPVSWNEGGVPGA